MNVRQKLLFVLSVCFMGVLLYTIVFGKDRRLSKIPLLPSSAVVQVKDLHIKGVKEPFNCSLVEDVKGDYLLAFRFMEGKKNRLGIAELDKNFEEKCPYHLVDTWSDETEDARIIYDGDDYYLVYNDQLPCEKHFCRGMYLSKLNRDDFTIEYKTSFDLHLRPVEKNWVPFVAKNERSEKEIQLAYSLVPHKILSVTDPKSSDLTQLFFKNNPSYRRFFWDWGVVRGGTPAIMVDGEYLSFFHSSFGKKRRWYVMGAYTFEAKPPYRVTRVSKHPIFYKEIKNQRIVFPSGFVQDRIDGEEVFHISYGEMDCRSKLVTIKKKDIFDAMKSLD
ncbi:MAG TPA: hypothetical protein P5048_01270 [Chlamydiales bacterium]|nr:hypothetical protein [Chlamydiales bacterium]